MSTATIKRAEELFDKADELHELYCKTKDPRDLECHERMWRIAQEYLRDNELKRELVVLAPCVNTMKVVEK